MKLKKFELCVLLLAFSVISFGCGYFIANDAEKHVISVEVTENKITTPENKENILLENEKEHDVSKEISDTLMVNINTADIDELCQLEGIGEVLAERILEYRTKNGEFYSVEELINVYGIGEKILEKLMGHITVK